MCQRVSGAHSGGVYAGHDNQFYGHRKIDKPDHLTWKSYALFLLDSMPETTAEHYRNKIAVYLRWYQKKVWRIFRIPNLRTLAPKISHPGGESAKYCSITITGAVSFRLAQPKAATISATVNAWKNIANNGDIMQQQLTQALEAYLQKLDDEARIEAINAFRRVLHHYSPFRSQPVDCVLWVKQELVAPTITTRITWRRRRSVCCKRRWRPTALPSRSSSSSNAHRRIRLSMVFTAMSWPAAKPR